MTGFSDPVDHSTEVEERMLEYEIQRVRQQAKMSTPYTGACHFCGSEVSEPKLFCNSDCREDWEHLQKMKKINGKR